MSKNKEVIKAFLDKAGIVLNGKQPWDLQVYNESFYQKVLSRGTLGLGEAYMDGWWDAGQVDEFICRDLRADLRKEVTLSWPLVMAYLQSWFTNLQSGKRALEVGEKHYDLGNDLYQKMLGPTMVYTCGYWKDVKTLGEAQIAKMDLICRKIGLQPGMRI